MPIRLHPPLIKEFTLDESDAAYGIVDNPTKISIRQATQGQQERREALFSNIIREWSKQADGVRLIQRFSFAELQRIEVMLTMCNCNLETEDGSALFRFNQDGFIVDEIGFKRAWDSLPPMVAHEIHSKVLEVNRDWRSEGGQDMGE